MEEDHRRCTGSGAEQSGQGCKGTSAGVAKRSQSDDPPSVPSSGTKRKLLDIYDESRLDGFVDDSSAMQDAIDKVFDKSSSPETSKKVFLRSQLQQLHKELVGIAEVR